MIDKQVDIYIEREILADGIRFDWDRLDPNNDNNVVNALAMWLDISWTRASDLGHIY